MLVYSFAGGNVKGSASLVQVVTFQILAVLFAIALVSGLIIIYSLNQEFKTQTQNLRNNLINEQKSLLQAEVNRAIDYIRVERSRVIRLAKENLLSETIKLHAQLEQIDSTINGNNHTNPLFGHKLFLNLVQSYNNQSTIDFTITSLEGIGIYHPKNPENEGKTLLHIRDAQHTRVVNEEIGMIKLSEEGFLSTFWQDENRQRQRVSYVKVFEPRNWYIRGSIDLEDFTEKIDEEIFAHLANRRFGKNNDGYFFINTFDGDLVLSNGRVYDPQPNIWDTKDPNGIYVVQQNSLIAQSSSIGGFSTYTWENLEGKLAPKISFVMPIPGRDLFIGAGVDLEYVNEAIAIQREGLQREITQQIYWIIGLFILATTLVSLLMFYLTKRMQGIINLFFKTFEKAATEQVEIPDEKIIFSEFRTLARSANGLIRTLKSQQDEIYYRASHDYLTVLPNRLLLSDRLELAILQAKRSKTKVAVVFMDLDFFKRINDTLGHDVGDEVLKNIASRLETVVRETDTLARIGGDEFIFIFNLNDKDELVFEVIDRILHIISEPLHVEDQTLNIGCSMGVAFYPDDGISADILTKHADIAMYEAKSKGRNTFQCFNPAMDSKIHDIIHLEREINLGIEAGEFELYYQPKIEVSTGIISGAEALLRWNHPKNGLLFPDTFMSVAEESGLIIPLGKWVIESAFSQIKRWETRGWRLDIAINLSVRQFEDPDFISYIKKTLVANSISPESVEFEITESFSAKSTRHISILNTLRSLGFRLAIDDFGTGYSSLSYLHKLPINCVKIDRDFITGMLENHDKMALVEIIIQISKIMHLNVVAEGVESKSDLEVLQYLKCDYYQGYYFSKPVPIALFNSLVLQQR